MDFEWDRRKAASNTRKHGVSFEEASSVFYDAFARVIDDPEHSMDEERYIVLGIGRLLRVLVVCYCVRAERQSIRIISARKATKGESAQYWRYRNEA